MRKIAGILFILISFCIKAQDHAIGLGTGISSLGIPPINLNYQFSYNALNTKAKITYFPFPLYVSNGNIFTNDYFIGIKTKEDKPVGVSFNFGASYLFIFNPIPYSDISNQLNPVFNFNFYAALNKNHRITTDFTISKYNFLYSPRHFKSSTLYLTIEIGYSYRFKKNVKVN